MTFRPSLHALVAFASITAALASVHCSASATKAEGDGSATALPEATNNRAADAASSDQVPPPLNAGAAPAPPVLADGLLLVNATRSFPAFRVCLPSGADAVSLSLSQPIPTELMPQSSLAGVDINGAMRIEPQPEFQGASEVVLLAIDDTTKLVPGIEKGSCRALACAQSGASCLGASKLFRVPVRDATTKAPAPGAFAATGKVLALRDDGGSPHFDVYDIGAIGSANASQLRVEYRNLSNYDGKVQYFREPGSAADEIREGASSIVSVNRKYDVARFTAGTYGSSLLDIHQASAPRVPIDSFYLAPGSFALLLVGSNQADASPDRGLRFLAIPLTAPKAIETADGGTADAAKD